jgi:hypothetical protein
MLRFKLHQIHIPSMGMYYLPLPKLTAAQVGGVASHLGARGFRVRMTGREGKLTATKGVQRIAIDGRVGLAGSSDDMLDALAPAIPALLGSKGASGGETGNVGERYFSVRQSRGGVRLQLFPRLESLRTWTCLRRDHICGLTPDEVLVLTRLLGKASRDRQVKCVTSIPREGSKPVQVGRKLYYESALPVAEFLSSLATIETGSGPSACYLPRDSVIVVPRTTVETRVSSEDLGEWCQLG